MEETGECGEARKRPEVQRLNVPCDINTMPVNAV
jgi:hypothetical protein